MLPPAPFDRVVEMRALIAAAVRPGDLRDRTPVINQEWSANTVLIYTEGPRIVRASTPPCGIVFGDGSFLTVFEEWSMPDGELLQYSYHYQQRSLFVRFDMDKKERRRVPKHHTQTSTLANKHLPSGGPVGLDAVLHMVVGQFLPRNL